MIDFSKMLQGREVFYIVLFLALLSLPKAIFAPTQSHPLSEISPVNVTLNMSSYNITNASYVFIETSLTCNGCVGSVSVANNAITSSKIADNSITASDLTANLGLGWANLTGYSLNTAWSGTLNWGNLTGFDLNKAWTGTLGWANLTGYNLNSVWTGTLHGGNITTGTITATQLTADLGLGFANLTNYPSTCGAGRAVQVIGDTLTCVSINESVTIGNLTVANASAGSQELVGYWTFDEGNGGYAYDSSGYSNIGTLTSMNTTGNSTSGWNSTDCKYGSCLKFDGINDYVNTSLYSSSVTSYMTISAWVKWSNVGSLGTYGLVSTGSASYPSERSWDFFINGSGACQNKIVWAGTTTGFGTVCSATSISAGTWTHVVVTVDNTTTSSNVKFYISGNLDATGSMTAPMGNTSRNIVIGALRRLTSGDSFFNGTIDEVRIYNRALSADEVKASYLSGADARSTISAKNIIAGDWLNVSRLNVSTSAQIAGLEFTGDLDMNNNDIYGADWLNGSRLNVSGAAYIQGNVGIGTTTPNYLLDVRGHINASGMTVNGSNVITVANASAGSQGLVGYWTFDEGAGSNAYDSFGYSNTGTLTNMNTTGNLTSGWNSTGCKYGGCLNFDGVNDYVQATSDVFNITGNVTVSAWVNPFFGQTNAGNVVYLNSQWSFYLLSNRKLQVGIRDATDWSYTSATTTAINNNTWTYLAYVCSPGVSTTSCGFYINGALDYTGTNVNIPQGVGAGTYARIGSFSGTTEQVNGTIDEVRIYSRALSADEIKAMYLTGADSRASISANNLVAGNWLNASRLNISSTAYIQGNVGIGTTGPTSKLYIQTDTAYSGNEVAAHGINIGTGVAADDHYLYMGADKTNDLSYIQSVGNQNYKPLVLQGRGGNVGIGTTTPNYLLEIANSSTALNVSGTLFVNGTTGRVGIGTTTMTNTKLNVTGNVTVSNSTANDGWAIMGAGQRMCLDGATCSKYIVYNGTNVVIQG